ncbi:type II toxin-antitoxin system YafQ family toxin [Polynucleobacter sp. AP-Kolm-20A-A1]|uniref:type II toxin-antitoxin system YafQ family toxin n=1 Tax=Polynucleobacter sp. AP-Kolm-20A-A1 TaxID=2081041 RepID=UPI001BFD567E|nr:type II toxin-antitoxin system YafQ family toxin [Polynucleobacter sp. AP-Kolm-20A-A1]QWE19887.1 type II toxin-antitoxin system YafQ family toxin [Polynucleobacter sp. AP-Kolm-20A-A1]
MRRIERTTQFKRDYKREAKGRYQAAISTILVEAVEFLVIDEALPARYFDHALTGQWSDFRDCHIKPDLILIYQKPNLDLLRLVRLGSHSQLGL